MDTAPTLVRRHALDAMAAGLVVEGRDVLPVDDERDALMPGSPIGLGFGERLSIVGCAEPAVGERQFGDEQLGVVPAFAGADLDDAFHLDDDPYFLNCRRHGARTAARSADASSGMAAMEAFLDHAS